MWFIRYSIPKLIFLQCFLYLIRQCCLAIVCKRPNVKIQGLSALDIIVKITFKGSNVCVAGTNLEFIDRYQITM